MNGLESLVYSTQRIECNKLCIYFEECFIANVTTNQRCKHEKQTLHYVCKIIRVNFPWAACWMSLHLSAETFVLLIIKRSNVWEMQILTHVCLLYIQYIVHKVKYDKQLISLWVWIITVSIKQRAEVQSSVFLMQRGSCLDFLFYSHCTYYMFYCCKLHIRGMFASSLS